MIFPDYELLRSYHELRLRELRSAGGGHVSRSNKRQRHKVRDRILLGVGNAMVKLGTTLTKQASPRPVCVNR